MGWGKVSGFMTVGVGMGRVLQAASKRASDAVMGKQSTEEEEAIMRFLGRDTLGILALPVFDTQRIGYSIQ